MLAFLFANNFAGTVFRRPKPESTGGGCASLPVLALTFVLARSKIACLFFATSLSRTSYPPGGASSSESEGSICSNCGLADTA